MPDDTFLPAYERDYENNNPIESFFEEMNSPDMWNNNNDDTPDDKLEDGLWSNNVVQPHYEFPSRARLDSVAKRYKQMRHRGDFKNYFNY